MIKAVEHHMHLWTGNLIGTQFADVRYEDEVDAALAFLKLAKEITKDFLDNTELTIEEVMHSFNREDDFKGMYVGSPGFLVVISKCEGGCFSPSWN